jgi:tape measure domain-containing protein
MARLQIEIDAKDASRALDLLERDLIDFESQVKKSERTTKKFSDNIAKDLKRAGLAVGGFFAVREAVEFGKELANLSDDYTKIDSKIKLVTEDAKEFEAIFESLYQQGRDTGTVLEVNAQAFAKLAHGMQEVERSEIVGYLETVNQSLTVAGAGTQESASFMLQFGQAMGSAVINGDELRSMVEANSYLMGKLATHIGTNIRGLKEMGAAGTLTREVFAKALTEISASVEDDFGQIPITIEKAVNKLNESWKRLFTDAEQAAGGSRTVALAISDLADTVEENREEITEVFVGILDSIPSVVSGIGSIGSEMLAFGGIVSDVYSTVKSIGGPGALEWGLVGAILLKGPKGYNGLLAGLVVVNSALENYNLHLGSLVSTSQEFGGAFENMWDVITGKRDFNTGALTDGSDELKRAAETWKAPETATVELDLDTSQAKDSLAELDRLQQNSARDWVKENEKATEKMIKKLSKEITDLQDDIADSTKDFASELRELQREGMTDEGAWKDLNKEISEFKTKAADAAKAGQWGEQADYLERIKELIQSMPDEVTETVSPEDVERARKIYDYQLRITRGGRSAVGDAAGPFQEAKKEYESLLAAQKDGQREVLSQEEVLKQKIEEMRQVNEDILENKKQQLETTAEEKQSLEKQLADYKEMASGATDATSELNDGAAEVGQTWVEVGDTWELVSNDIIDQVQNISAELDTAIGKMNELDAGVQSSGSDTGTSGARAFGGPVEAGKEYWVGERGREKFTPSTSGFITPNNKLGGDSSRGMIDINLNLGGETIKLQGDQTNIDALQRQIADKERYTS